RKIDRVGRDRVGILEGGGDAQRLGVVARRAGKVARFGEVCGARFGFRKPCLRERAVIRGRRARATRGEHKQARSEPAHQRERPLPWASKLSIGSMPSELSLKESLSGQMRLAAVSTSPTSRAAVSL